MVKRDFISCTTLTSSDGVDGIVFAIDDDFTSFLDMIPRSDDVGVEVARHATCGIQRPGINRCTLAIP